MFPTPADVQSILTVDAGLLLGMILLMRLLDPTRFADRILFGAATACLLMVYAVWRWRDTLPRLALTAESLWSYLFFSFESAAIIYTLLSIVILVRSIDRTSSADAAEARLVESGRWPAVDVFICTYDEPLDVLERSILTALALDYPRFTVWVLDDTRRDWLREYCDNVGARYLSRPDNKDAKAGNLNNALDMTARETDAPFILVLDADFATARRFLRRTVGLLCDPAIGVVQTPQHYFNADPIQHNLLAQSNWVDDQRFFFDVFQPAKDAWGCAFCVGTSFVVKRRLLEKIGGFPSEAICEDINLTYTLLSKGYKTIWLNERLSCGLAAEGIGEYITQRTRWCLGTIQVALLPTGPLFGGKFTFTERWHYVHGLMNWLGKPFILLLLVAPPIYWFGGLPAFHTDYLSFLRYGMAALIGQLSYMNWVSCARTLPLFMEATHAISAFAVSVTLIRAVFKPFGQPFKVTDKGGDRSKPRVHWRLAAMFGMIGLSSLASIVWAFISPYAAAEISSLDFFNLLWAAVAILIALIAFVACFERRRDEEIFAVGEDTYVIANNSRLSCALVSLSTSVANITVGQDDLSRLTRHLTLLIPGIGLVTGSLTKVTATSAQVHIRPSPAQRAQLLLTLYPSPNTSVASRARMTATAIGLWRRGFSR